MSCLLCFSAVAEDERLGINEFIEQSVLTALELIQTHLNFAEKIIPDNDSCDPESWICHNCWTHLETFHDFHETVSANYNSKVIESNYGTSKIFVSDDLAKDVEDVAMKSEVEDDDENNDAEFLEEIILETEDPKDDKPSFHQQPRTTKQHSIMNDSADDQRIRETANMCCDMCEYVFESLREAKAHYKNAHAVEGYISCCKKKFKQRYRLVEHVNIHYNLSHSCPVCSKNFNCRSYLTQHIALHDENKQYECAHCSKRFSKKHQVRNHLLKVHIFDNVEKTFCCPIENCGKKFVSPGRLKLHVDYTHPTKLEICEICSKTFKTKNAIDEHMKMHARKAEDRIRCEICGHFLADRRTYNRHIKNHETEKLDNTCSYCGKKSPNSNALKKHIRYVHEMKNTLQCKFCDKSFKRPRNLTDHEAAMHTLEDLYACTFCTKTFRNQSNMLAHRKKQHPEQYQKPNYMRDAL